MGNVNDICCACREKNPQDREDEANTRVDKDDRII